MDSGSERKKEEKKSIDQIDTGWLFFWGGVEFRFFFSQLPVRCFWKSLE